MDALVLGGTRYVGLRLVELLHGQGHRVTVLNRGQLQAKLPEGVERLTADRNNVSEVEAALRGKQYDAAFDISAYAPSTLKPVVDALDGRVGHFVFCSTTGVYAPSERAPIEEDFPLNRDAGAGTYSGDKILCEELLMEAHQQRGFPATVIRPPYIYGPHNYVPEREFSFFARLKQGRPVIVPGDGVNLIQPVHVDDLGAAFAAVPGNKQAVGQIYTACQLHANTINAWYRTVGEIMDVPVDIVHVDGEWFDRTIDELGVADFTEVFPFFWGSTWVFSTEKARRDLEWSPRYTLRDGLAMTYKWWLDQGLDKEESDFTADDKMLAAHRSSA